MSEALPPEELAALLATIAAGDTAAETTLIRHFLPRVRAQLLARTRNPDVARDLTQETLMALLQAARRGQVREPDRVAAFVAGIARNVANNHLRGVKARAEAPLEELPGDPMTADDHDRTERQALLSRALDELSPSDRQILLMTLVDGLKPGEIAGRLGLNPDVVRTRKSRAQRRVVSALREVSRMGSRTLQ
jgi:RNA polymerase sigma-70 factor, ECF subfamily